MLSVEVWVSNAEELFKEKAVKEQRKTLSLLDTKTESVFHLTWTKLKVDKKRKDLNL